MVAGDPFGMEEDDLGKKQICPSPDGYMDDKENICAVNDLVVPKETPMLRPRSSRKAKGFNLRKSLAWNNAFFTEEGVLDPMELSTLTTGSVSKMNGTSLSVNKGGMSPLMRFNHSGERSKPAFHDLEEKMCSKGSAKSRVKDAKGSKTISKLEVSIHGEPDMDVVSERIASGKGTVPLSPILSSQKRVANTSRTNPASKIPKFVHAKTSLHLGSRSVMMSTNISKCNQSVARVNTTESTGLNRGFSPDTEKGVDSSSSSAKHSDGLKKNMVEKASDTSKVNHDPSFQRKIHRSIISSGSGKLLSSLKKNDHQICGDPPAGPTLARVKPSGLRMPSPTMGFFSQGKVSALYSGQSQRTIQPVISKTPPRKVTSEKLICESRPLSAATEQKPTMCTLATKSNSVHVVSSRSQAIPAPNCSKPSIAALVRYPDVNSKLRMMPLHEHDREGLTSSGNPNCPTNGQSLLPVEAGEGRTVNPSLESNLSDDTHDANLLSENSGEHGIPCSKFSTKLHYACKLQECNLRQEDCDSVSSNLVKNPEVEDSKDGHYPVMIEDKHSIGNSICELQFGYTTKRVDHVTSMDDESSLRLNMEQKAENNVPSSSLNVDLSSSQGTGTPIQALMPETSYLTGISVQSEDAVIARLQEREHSDAVKSDAVPMKNQINAVPFSDEWLAAVESFGEEILELKTGPVQNSPPEKALPEPGPWSPVKRKAQDIGPFDCTKYSKNPSASETQ